MKPTESQLRQFWEWCGFHWVQKHFRVDLVEYGGYWQSPFDTDERFGHFVQLPKIDLNTLFKYAVPKLEEFDFDGMTMWQSTDGWVCELALQHDTDWREGQGKDAALALFWAIYKLLDKEEK